MSSVEQKTGQIGGKPKRIHKDTTISITKEFKKELDELKTKYFFNAAFMDFLPIAWPRCPSCGGLLIQKFASKHLMCTKCGREYELVGVKS